MSGYIAAPSYGVFDRQVLTGDGSTTGNKNLSKTHQHHYWWC